MSECKNCDKWVILGAWKPIMMSLGCKGKPCGWRRKSHPCGPDTEWRNSEDLEKMMSVLAVSSWGGGCGGWRWMAEELNSFFTDMTAERKTKKKKRHSADHSTYSTDTLKKVNCSWFLGTLNRRNVNAPPTALAQQLHHRRPKKNVHTTCEHPNTPGRRMASVFAGRQKQHPYWALCRLIQNGTPCRHSCS